MKIKRNKAVCEKYQLDLTDYVTGDMTFLTKQKQQELFAHLRKCQTCRQDFFDWEETFGVLVTKEHHAKPETQKRMDALIKQFRKTPSPALVKPVRGEKILDNQGYIGDAAGKVWLLLAKNSKIPLTSLPRKTKLPPYIAYSAMGWLAKENKVFITKKKKDTFVYLAEHERNIYQQRQAQV